MWIVTNNKNSPDNSADVRANTRRFYAELSGDPRVTRIVGFLVRMPAQGRVFAERGLVVYAVAVGEDAGAGAGPDHVGRLAPAPGAVPRQPAAPAQAADAPGAGALHRRQPRRQWRQRLHRPRRAGGARRARGPARAAAPDGRGAQRALSLPYRAGDDAAGVDALRRGRRRGRAGGDLAGAAARPLRRGRGGAEGDARPRAAAAARPRPAAGRGQRRRRAGGAADRRAPGVRPGLRTARAGGVRRRRADAPRWARPAPCPTCSTAAATCARRPRACRCA